MSFYLYSDEPGWLTNSNHRRPLIGVIPSCLFVRRYREQKFVKHVRTEVIGFMGLDDRRQLVVSSGADDLLIRVRCIVPRHDVRYCFVRRYNQRSEREK